MTLELKPPPPTARDAPPTRRSIARRLTKTIGYRILQHNSLNFLSLTSA